MALYRDDEYGGGGGSSSYESEEDFSWISYFVSCRGHEFFCEVDTEYIEDQFNLVGLQSQVHYYEHALDLITDVEPEEQMTDAHRELVDNDADVLYGFVHARYITTTKGLTKMREKFMNGEFGTCPRDACDSQKMLPSGVSDSYNNDVVKQFCPKCEELYKPPGTRYSKIDGCFFGTTFAHLFFLVYPELKPEKTPKRYVPRVYGFKLHPTWHEKALEAKTRDESARRAAKNSTSQLGSRQRPTSHR